MNNKNTPEKVAEVVEGSGFFHTRTPRPVCNKCGTIDIQEIYGKKCPSCQDGELDFRMVYYEPTSDQAEEILGKMGLQVVWVGGGYELGVFEQYGTPECTDNVYIYAYRWKVEYSIPNVPQGHRTHANNAGLAYCCKNMFDELKEVMNGLQR